MEKHQELTPYLISYDSDTGRIYGLSHLGDLPDDLLREYHWLLPITRMRESTQHRFCLIMEMIGLVDARPWTDYRRHVAAKD